MAYADIDPAIRQWTDANAVVLFNEWAHEETRCFYLANFIGGVCQVVIDAPRSDGVELHVYWVESAGNPTDHKSWVVAVPDLWIGLDVAYAFARDRTRQDGAS